MALRKYIPFALLAVINLVAAGYDVITSAAFAESSVHPTVYAFVRAVGATVILVGLGIFKERQRPPHDRVYWLAKEDVWIVIAAGVLALAGHMGLSAIALASVPPAIVGMFAPVVPAIALVISIALKLEPFNYREFNSWLKASGAAITLLGAISVAVVTVLQQEEGVDPAAHGKSGGSLTMGLVFLVLAKTCCASYPILQKVVLARYRSAVVTAWMYIFGSVSLLTSVIPLSTDAQFWQFNKASGLALLYAIVLASAVNYSLIAAVNKRLNPVILTASYPTESVFAPIFAYLFLGQKISVADGITGAFIIMGLAMTVTAKWRELSALDDDDDANASRAATGGTAGVDGVGRVKDVTAGAGADELAADEGSALLARGSSTGSTGSAGSISLVSGGLAALIPSPPQSPLPAIREDAAHSLSSEFSSVDFSAAVAGAAAIGGAATFQGSGDGGHGADVSTPPHAGRGGGGAGGTGKSRARTISGGPMLAASITAASSSPFMASHERTTSSGSAGGGGFVGAAAAGAPRTPSTGGGGGGGGGSGPSTSKRSRKHSSIFIDPSTVGDDAPITTLALPVAQHPRKRATLAGATATGFGALPYAAHRYPGSAYDLRTAAAAAPYAASGAAAGVGAFGYGYGSSASGTGSGGLMPRVSSTGDVEGGRYASGGYAELHSARSAGGAGFAAMAGRDDGGGDGARGGTGGAGGGGDGTPILRRNRASTERSAFGGHDSSGGGLDHATLAPLGGGMVAGSLPTRLDMLQRLAAGTGGGTRPSDAGGGPA